MKTPDLRPSILHARSIGLFFAFGLACLAQAKVVSVCAAGPPTCDAATIALGLTQAAAADVIELRSDITEAVNLTRTVSEIRADGVRNRYWTSGGATSTLEISNAMPGAVAVRNVVMNHVSGTGHTIGWNPGGTGSLLLQDCDFSISSSADCVYVGTGSLTGNWDMLVVRNCNFDGSGATGAVAVGLYIHNANFLNAISVYNSLFRNWNNSSAALVNRNSTSVQTMRVYNCLFDGNGGAAGSGMQVWSPGEYKNNVFTGNHQDVTIASNGNLAHLSYCAFGTLSAGYGPNCLSGVVRAQCYVNAGTDFHIKAGSATIDTGTTLTHTAQDKDGITRPIGAAYDIGPYEGVAVTPSPSPTPSFSPTISNTWTASSTPTDSPVPSATPTWSLTHTLTDSPTPSATRTWSLTYTLTNSPSPSASPTWTLSHTLTKSPTPSITETWTPTLTRTTSPTPSITETWTPSDTLTDSPTPSVTLTWSLTYTLTSSPTPSVTKTETMTASPTRTPTPTATESASPTGTPSATLSRTPTLTSTPTPTNSPSLTATVTAPGTYTASPTATQSPTPLPTPLGDRLLVAPNPVLGDDSFVLIDWRPGVPMDVVIFGLDGGRVRDLGLRTPPLQWDLRSASGAMTGPGIYIVSVRVPGERRPRFARLARVR